MNAVQDENALYKFYKVLLNEFLLLKTQDLDKIKSDYKDVSEDKLMQLILANNGCKFKDNSMYHTVSITDTYNVIFWLNALGNNTINYFDFIKFYGTDNLIIFLDYFDGIFKDRKDLIESLGRSKYYDAIAKLTELFIQSEGSYNLAYNNNFSVTALANNVRFAPYLISAKILKEIADLNEDDVEIIPLHALNKYLEIDMKLLLLGVKYNE